MRHQQKIPARSFQNFEADAITFHFVDGLFHWEANIGATSVGACCKEFKYNLLLHLQNSKGSGHGETLPFSYNRNPEKHLVGSRERSFRVGAAFP